MHDYQLIDFGSEEKLERWGEFILRRPDINAFGQISNDPGIKEMWQNPDLYFHRDSKEAGHWQKRNELKKIPETWEINFPDSGLKLKVKPTKYKHTGVFPEQEANWEWISKKITDSKKLKNREIKVLNLFAYTGGATLATAKAGTDEIVHIDSSKGANSSAKENQILNNLENKNIRIITEDVQKFVQKEIKRGRKYDCIIMDPPLYGRGPKGELWKIEKDLPKLLSDCKKLLSNQPILMLINLYANAGPNLVQQIRAIINGKHEVVKLTLKSKTQKSLACGQALRITFE